MKCAFAVFLISLFLSSARADPPASDYFFYSDQLVREYHLRRSEVLPPVDVVVMEFLNSQPPLQSYAVKFVREADAFKKRDIGDAIEAVMRSRMTGSPSRYISFYYEMHLEPYDFGKRRFGVCFERQCLDRRPYPIHAKFGAQRYELTVSDAPNRIFFSPEETIARHLERLAASSARRVPVLIVVEAVDTEEARSSGMTPYRRLLSNIVGVHFLSRYPAEVSKMPQSESILYSITKS